MPQPPLSPSLVPNWSQFPKQTLLTPQFTTPIILLDSNWVAPGVGGSTPTTRLIYPLSSAATAQYQFGSDIAPLNTNAPFNYSVVWYSITATRNAYLPPARYVGQMITLCDMSGSLTQSVYIGIFPSGSDTIDSGSSTTLTMAKGSRTLLCIAPGTWITVGAQGQKIVLSYTSNGTHTPGPNIRYVTVTCVGEGGGGGGSTGTSGAAGGGGGAISVQTVAVTPYTGYSITCSGGANGGSGGANGNDGATTSFGSLASAPGGGGGGGESGAGSGFPGVFGVSGRMSATNTVPSWYGTGAPYNTTLPGGSAWAPGGTSGGAATTHGGGGGGSFGTGGNGGISGSTGPTTGGYGSGGGGASSTSTSGANGGGGLVLVEWVVN